MEPGGKFNPLNIACMLFIVVMVYLAVKFDNRGEDYIREDMKERMRSDVPDFINEANGYGPFKIMYSKDKTGDRVFLICKIVDYKDGQVIFRTYFKDPEKATESLGPDFTNEAILQTLYWQFIDFSRYTSQNLEKSKILDGIVESQSPVVLQLEADDDLGESRVLDQREITYEEYLPLWHEYGLKSTNSIVNEMERNDIQRRLMGVE